MSSDTVRIERASRRGRSRAAGRSGVWANEALLFPLIVGVVHWLLVQIPATLAFLNVTPRDHSAPYSTLPPPMDGLAHWIVEPMRQWDGLWYRLIAVEGYGAGSGTAKAAFWPLFPWLMEWGSRITGWSYETVGYLGANLSFFGALLVVYRLVSLDFDRATARRTLWALALFPTALFFTAVYTESIFLLLAAASLLAARQGGWWAAGIFGLLAALTRSAGVMLLAPFAVLFLKQYGTDIRRWFPSIIPAALPALGPAIFGWHLTEVGAKFWDFVTVQEQWYRFNATPLETFRCATQGCDATLEVYQNGQVPFPVDGADWGWVGAFFDNLSDWTYLGSFTFRNWVGDSDTLELSATILAFALAIIGLRKLPLFYSAFVLPPLVVPLFSPGAVHPLMSMPRFILPLFPLFVVIALLVKDRRIGVPLAVLSAALLALLSMQFANWYWVS
ncbi:MAG: hypothetical protein H0W06_11020 [Chloroflexia bacterium]|nr:hypothetical protein [Chloroflexia bacterium]